MKTGQKLARQSEALPTERRCKLHHYKPGQKLTWQNMIVTFGILRLAHRPFFCLEGFRNNPEPHGYSLFQCESISSHMDPFQTIFMLFIRLKILKTIYLDFSTFRRSVVKRREVIFPKVCCPEKMLQNCMESTLWSRTSNKKYFNWIASWLLGPAQEWEALLVKLSIWEGEARKY